MTMPNSNGKPQPAVAAVPQTPTAGSAILAHLIERYGIRLPILTDQNGEVVDGKKRKPIAESLGIACPTLVQEFGSAEERDQVAAALNLARYLDPMPKRELIRAFLLLRPLVNNKELADAIGVSQNTVAAERQELEATFQIEKSETFQGRDGKRRPAHYRPRKQIVANTKKELSKAQAVIAGLPASCDGRIVDVTTASRRARRNIKKQQLAGEVIVPTPDEEIRLYHCRFQDLDDVAGIAPDSVAAFFLDVPYEEEFLAQFHDLAAMARRDLAPGGIFACYVGTGYLNRVLRVLDDFLTFIPPFCSVWSGDANLLHKFGIVNHWKPIVAYSKGPWRAASRFSDVRHCKSKEKDLHPWQQNLDDVEHWIRHLTKPGNLVVDCVGGSFTTAIACRNLGRRFVGCDVAKQCVLAGQKRLAEIPVISALKEFYVTLADRHLLIAADSPYAAALVMAEQYLLEQDGNYTVATEVSDGGEALYFHTETLFEQLGYDPV